MARIKSELHTLEKYAIAFLNIEGMPEVKSVLEDYGYDASKIEEGKKLYKEAKDKFAYNKEESEKEKIVYKSFSDLYHTTIKTYQKHRKIAKVALMNHKDVWSLLKINGTLPSTYLETKECAKTFYIQAHENHQVKPILNQFKITQEEIDTQLSNIEKIELLKAEYSSAKGRSQDATQQKNKAFMAIYEWMRVLYAVAKIAFMDRPQLLESLMKVVKK